MNRLVLYVNYGCSLLSRIYLLPIYFLSGLFERRWDVWVFGSWGGKRYSDNAAAFFEYCHAAIPDQVSLVWISRKKSIVDEVRQRGFEAYWIWSIRGILSCLRAKVFLFDSFSKDINFWLSRGAVKINLWSGVPLKKCEREIDNPRNRYYRLFHGSMVERVFLSAMMPWHAVRPDYVIATSPVTREITCKSFDIPAERVWITGYPRNDVLYASKGLGSNAQTDLPSDFAEAVAGGKKIFLYLPTYRDSGKDFIDIDWKALDELMLQMNAVFFFKFHPDHVGGFSEKLRGVVELPKAIDIYNLLPHTTALISDYSSIIFDYMLLGTPIIYYVPDLEEFASSSRSLNFQPDEVAVGPLCMSSAALFAALSALARGDESESQAEQAKWREVRSQFNAYSDGEFCRRVLDEMRSRIPECAFLKPGVKGSKKQAAN